MVGETVGVRVVGTLVVGEPVGGLVVGDGEDSSSSASSELSLPLGLFRRNLII